MKNSINILDLFYKIKIAEKTKNDKNVFFLLIFPYTKTINSFLNNII